MREVLYFQAGRFSNFIGTHFWNTQEGYFTYGEDAEEPLVNHDVSFREGVSRQGDPTFCPRLLLFDRKSNFGALSDVYGDAQDEVDDITAEWNGETVQYHSEPIRRSEYHAQLAAESAEEHMETEEGPHEAQVQESDVKFWSDYSRVNLHPRGVHRLPDLPDWEDMEGDWVNGADTFERYDEDNDFIEDSFRAFVEECDHLHGLQVMSDSLTFGGFTHAFLTRFRDDFAKLPCIAFPVLSGLLPDKIDADDSRAVKKALNDALLVQSLSELSTLTVPVQSPSLWTSGRWSQDLNLTHDSVYQTSALLATHIEDVTLPMRLKYNHTDLASIVASLSWRSDKLFTSLQGAFPLPATWDAEKLAETLLYDFSAACRDTTTRLDPKSTYARTNVSRGMSATEQTSFSTWAERFRPEPYTLHAPPVPLPSSFPRLLRDAPVQARALSGLASDASLAGFFGGYGALAQACLGRHRDVAVRMGLEDDDVRELRDSMWELEDAYRGEDSTDSAGMSEDE